MAAGEGRRFGGVKQLADLNGRPLLEYAIEAMTGAPQLERVLVVLGAHADKIGPATDFGRAEPVICEGWKEGMAASLRYAVESLPEADPLVIALGDQPGLSLAAIDAVLRAVRDNPSARAARALYNGTPGHPVALRATLRGPVLRLRGDAGAVRVLTEAGALEVDCTALGRGADVNTREQLEGLKAGDC